MGIGLVVGAVAVAPVPAQAGDYCREYTRTVYIGNRAQDAYGTACMQPDGSWMIVGEGLGNDIPDYATDVNYVIHDNRRDIVPTRVVYYNARPTYRYRSNPAFVWNHNGFYRNGIYISYSDNHYRYKKNKRYHRYDRDDDWRHDRGNNRGHGHH